MLWDITYLYLNTNRIIFDKKEVFYKSLIILFYRNNVQFLLIFNHKSILVVKSLSADAL